MTEWQTLLLQAAISAAAQAAPGQVSCKAAQARRQSGPACRQTCSLIRTLPACWRAALAPAAACNRTVPCLLANRLLPLHLHQCPTFVYSLSRCCAEVMAASTDWRLTRDLMLEAVPYSLASMACVWATCRREQKKQEQQEMLGASRICQRQCRTRWPAWPASGRPAGGLEGGSRRGEEVSSLSVFFLPEVCQLLHSSPSLMQQQQHKPRLQLAAPCPTRPATWAA